MSEATVVGGPARVDEQGQSCMRRLGRYELVEEVGRGSFARVYRARDPRLKREVAVKALRTEFVDDETMIARVYREARAAARLRHPAIVPVYEVAEDGGQAYIVTEFISGGTLDDALNEGVPAFEDAARTVARVADALHYAHLYGVVHRDVKPANIMTNDAGEPVVADFGLAMHVDAEMTLSEGGGIVGTPAYMAPEQASGTAPVDGRADVYALGVVLYRMLTGRLPFEGGWTATIHMVVSVEPPRPRQLRGAIPVDLETITQRAMAKRPADRYATAAEFADDLRRWLEHLPIRARRRGPFGRTALWARRNPLEAATIVSALVVVCAVVAVAFVRVARERDLFLDQRDESNANLYRALVGEAAALARAGETAWWWRVLENVEAAAALDVEGRDAGELRRIAIETLGSTRPCLRVHRILDGHSGPVYAVAAGEGFAVTLAADGMRAWRLPDGEPLGTVFGAEELEEGGVVRDVAAIPGEPGFVSVDDAGRLRWWRVTATGVEPRLELVIPGPLCVDVARDGSLAVGCRDGRVRVRDGEAPRELAHGHRGAVSAVSFDDTDPRRLASAGADLAVRVQDLGTGELESVSPVVDPPSNVLLSGGTVFMASIPSYGVARFDLGGGAVKQRRIHDGGVPDVARDDAGELLTIGHDGAVKLLTRGLDDLASGRVRLGDGRAVVAAPGDRFLVAGYDRGAVIWERSKPGIRQPLPASHRYDWLPDGTLVRDRAAGSRALAVSPLTSIAVLGRSGRYVTGAADGTVTVRTLGGEIVDEIEGDAAAPAVVAAARDGSSWSYTDGTRVVVRAAGRSCSIEIGEDIDRVLPGPDGTLAVRWAGGISLVATGEGGRVVSTQPRGEFAFIDGDLVVAFDGTLRTAHADTGRAGGDHAAGGDSPVTAMACDPDAGTLLIFHADGSLRMGRIGSAFGAEQTHAGLPEDVVRMVSDSEAWHALVIRANGVAELWDLDRGTRLAELHRVAAVDAAFVDDDHVLLATSHGEVRGFTVAGLLGDRRASLGDEQATSNTVFSFRRTGTLVAGGHPDAIWGTAASPDGRFVATCGHDAATKLWDAATGRLVRTIRGHAGVAWSVAFDADGRRLATGSGGRVVITDVATGAEVARLDGHDGMLVSGVAFSHDGALLATTGYDGTARLWDLGRGAETAVLVRVDSSAHDVRFSPDGRRLAVAANDGCVRVWDLEEPAVRAAVASEDIEDVPPARTMVLDSVPWAVGFDPASPRLAAACEDGSIRVWPRPDAAEAVRLDSDASLLRSVAFSPDGARLAAGAFAGPGVLWDLTALNARLARLGVPAW